MKYSAFAPVFLAAAGLAFAQTPPQDPPPAPPAAPEAAPPAAKKSEFKIKAEVVSSDLSAKTLTVQKVPGMPESTPGMPDKPRTGGTSPSTEKGPSVTLAVDEGASASLADLKAGDTVELTCTRTIGPDTVAAPGTPGSTSSAPGSAPAPRIGAGDGPRSLSQCEKVTAIRKS